MRRMPLPHEPIKTVRRVIDLLIRKIERGAFTLRVPRARNTLVIERDKHFHLQPELFVQLAGRTRFQFPDDKFTLAPGELCLVPRRVVHFETARPERGAFATLVIFTSFHQEKSAYMSCILGGEIRPGRPGMVDTVRFEFPNVLRLCQYLDDIVEIYRADIEHKPRLLKGLLLVYFSWLGHVLRRHYAPVSEPFKVRQARQFVTDHLAEPDLSVQRIAAWIKCSPDYLSCLFHQATGLPLVKHINEQRISQAYRLLENSSLNIAEISRAVGYETPGYFGRVFLRSTGQTPRAYRSRQR